MTTYTPALLVLGNLLGVLPLIALAAGIEHADLRADDTWFLALLIPTVIVYGLYFALTLYGAVTA